MIRDKRASTTKLKNKFKPNDSLGTASIKSSRKGSNKRISPGFEVSDDGEGNR